MAKQKIDNSKLLMHVGSEIKKRRVGMSLSQEMLAELSELHTTTISDIERGKSNLTLASLEMIAKALQCQESHFLPSIHEDSDKEVVEICHQFTSFYKTLPQADKKKFHSIVQGVIKAFS